MQKKRIVVFTVLITLLSLYVVALNIINKPKVITRTTDTITLESTKNIVFQDFGADNFTCTGLTWDEHDNTFWIGDYGAMINKETLSPRVVAVSVDFSNIRNVIDLSGVLSTSDNLQGVAYDISSNSLWLAVGDTVKNIDKSGILISEFSLDKYSKYKSNGICVDNTDNTLWVLCYSKYLLHYDKSGDLLNKFDVNFYNQDQLAMKDGFILATIGADYHGEENYIVSINKDTGKIKVEYQVIGSYAVEGLCVIGEKLYIANDGLYHDAKIRESYISVFKLK